MKKSIWMKSLGATLATVMAAGQFAVPVGAVESTDEPYVYGTVNLPYADYYYGELNDVAENAQMQLDAADPTAAIRAEGYYDAVTSATTVKSKKYETTYYTEDERAGTVTVEGIKGVSIAVPESLYGAAQEAITNGETCNNQLLNIIGSMTVNEDQTVVPAEYKVLNGDGTLTAMIDSNEAVTVTDAEIKVSTNTTYGNYQISISDETLLPSSGNMEGVVITTSDGAKYAMLHVDNLWLRTGEIAWAIEDGYLVHNANTLKYKNFEDTEGKTITSIRYIIRDGADVTYTTESYLPLLHDGTATIENTAVTAGEFAVTLANLPAGYEAVAEAAELNTTYSNGVLSYDTTGVKPGSYAVVVSDAAGVYAQILTTVVLTTEDLPAAFDAETGSIIAAEGADAEDLANYLSKVATVSVNGTSYKASGRGSTKIIDLTTGAIDFDVTTNNGRIFSEPGTYTLVISATGYTNDLTFEVKVTGDAFMRGDVDDDGAVTLTDATLALTEYAEIAVNNPSTLTEDQLKAADVDGDGSVTLADATYILTYYAEEAVNNAPTWEGIIGA